MARRGRRGRRGVAGRDGVRRRRDEWRPRQHGDEAQLDGYVLSLPIAEAPHVASSPTDAAPAPDDNAAATDAVSHASTGAASNTGCD